MAPSTRRWSLLFVGLLVVALVAVAFQQTSNGRDQSVERLDSELEVLDAKVTKLEGQLAGIGDLGPLRESITALQASVDDLRKVVDGAAAEDAALGKKIDDVGAKLTTLSTKVDGLSTKISQVEQRIWVLENRYNDHLRKYHNGG